MAVARHEDNEQLLEAIDNVLEGLEHSAGSVAVAREIARQLERPLVSHDRQANLVRSSLSASKTSLDLCWTALDLLLAKEVSVENEQYDVGRLGGEVGGVDGDRASSPDMPSSEGLRRERRSGSDRRVPQFGNRRAQG